MDHTSSLPLSMIVPAGTIQVVSPRMGQSSRSWNFICAPALDQHASLSHRANVRCQLLIAPLLIRLLLRCLRLSLLRCSRQVWIKSGCKIASRIAFSHHNLLLRRGSEPAFTSDDVPGGLGNSLAGSPIRERSPTPRPKGEGSSDVGPGA